MVERHRPANAELGVRLLSERIVMSYQIEILGPTGAVHYRRPIDHQMVRDALTTPGYAVRWPGCRDMRKLDDLPQNCKAEVTFPAEGMTAACPKREQKPC